MTTTTSAHGPRPWRRPTTATSAHGPRTWRRPDDDHICARTLDAYRASLTSLAPAPVPADGDAAWFAERNLCLDQANRAWLEAAWRQGHDFNRGDPAGRTALTYVAAQHPLARRYDEAATAALMDWLMQRGANPLAPGTPGGETTPDALARLGGAARDRRLRERYQRLRALLLRVLC